MKEIWKDIYGYKRIYKVSNLGRIKSLKRKVKSFKGKTVYTKTIKEKILVQTPYRGYGYVTLRKDGDKKVLAVHRLVALSFVKGRTISKNTVNHINGNKLDNNPKNLEWCTQSYNARHAFASGIVDMNKKVRDGKGRFSKEDK